MKSGVYLFVFFNWPTPFQAEHGQKAIALHRVVQGKDWISEVVTASGGVGRGPSSVWVFHLKEYASLDRLMMSPDDEVGQAYRDFFSQMEDVEDMVREEVVFKDQSADERPAP